MISTDPMFLETVSPTTRKVLVSGRLAAMRGRLEEVCNRLKDRIAATPPDKHSDLVALGLLWSELLYLDGQDTESLTVFKEVVEPRQPSLPIPIQLVCTENLSVLQMKDSPGKGVSTFYHLVDRRRVAQFKASESDSLLAAQSAIENDRFTEALPLLWQNLLRAYNLVSWRESRWAAERLAKLYLKAGELEQACHYLIVAEADKEVEHLAVAIARRGDPDLIRSILRRLMDFANLRRHFIVACKFLAMTPDLIPDGEVETLAEWLLPRCREHPAFNGGGVMRAAWKAVRKLGHRVSQTTSRRLIESALSHPEWLAPIPGGNRFLPNREVMVKAVTFLAHSAPKEHLPEIAESTLPLAIERIQDHDYGDVINLLCNLSQLGGEALLSKIKKTLYVPGKPVNRILAQLAGFFGVEALNPGQWEEFASQLIEETRLTVQRMKLGETPKPIAETLMTVTQTTPEGQLQVTIQGGVGLEALVRGKQHLSDATIERIVQVLVEMSMNRDNILSNRELLLSQLCGFADRTQPGLRDEVVRTLEPLARGEVPESTEYPKSSAGRHPFASASVNMGTPQQVQAMALIAAATYCGSDSALSRLIGEALFDGFVNQSSTVRRGAYAAARRLPELSSEQLLPILMGLRDPDPEAAVAAFAAFAERKEWSLTRPMWKLFLLATRLATQSPDSNLRRHAALALRARLAHAPTEATRSEAQAIVEAFSADVAYSVREAVIR
jgi:hypothetical protein